MTTVRLMRKAGKVIALGLALTVAAAPARAQEDVAASGDWLYRADADLAAAWTSNADGAVLGMVCARNCTNYIDIGRACRDGERYPGRMEGRTGTFPVEFTCRLVEDRYVLLTPPNEDFINIVGGSTEIAYSVNLDPAGPSTFRFSLHGAYDAIYTTLEAGIAIADRLDTAAASAAAVPRT